MTDSSPRNILLVVDCYLPSHKSIARMADDLARAFVARGHSVTVLVPSDGQASPLEITRELAGLELIRFRTGRIKGAPLPIRAMNEMLLSLAALWRTRRVLAGHRFDSIVFYSPSIFFGPLVAWLKRRWRARTYLILRDIFPEWAVQTGVLKRGLVYHIFRLFERLQYSVADVIGVETSRSGDYFAGSPHRSKLMLLRNWAVPQPSAAPGGDFRRRLGLEGKTVFFYGGNIGIAQDMDNIVRLARRMLAHPDVHFLLVGEGSEFERIRNAAQADKLDNMTLLPSVDQATYFSMLAEFDVGLISLDGRLKTFNSPGKMLGYMSCGIPILASINEGNDMADLLGASCAGLCSINGDDESFYRNALRLRDFTLRRQMGENSKRLLNAEFSLDSAVKRILHALAAPPDLVKMAYNGHHDPICNVNKSIDSAIPNDIMLN